MTNPVPQLRIHRDQPVDNDSKTESATRTDVIDLADDLAYLVASAEPAVVFSSLARLCVPAFSDTCTVDIVEHERAAYRITYPHGDSNTALPGQLAKHTSPRYRISTRFDSPPGENGPAYFGVITHTWHRHGSTAANATRARLLTEHAVAAITGERQADATYHRGEVLTQK